MTSKYLVLHNDLLSTIRSFNTPQDNKEQDHVSKIWHQTSLQVWRERARYFDDHPETLSSKIFVQLKQQREIDRSQNRPVPILEELVKRTYQTALNVIQCDARSISKELSINDATVPQAELCAFIKIDEINLRNQIEIDDTLINKIKALPNLDRNIFKDLESKAQPIEHRNLLISKKINASQIIKLGMLLRTPRLSQLLDCIKSIQRYLSF